MASEPVSAIWDIGRPIGQKLKAQGIKTALDFVHAHTTTLRKQFGVTVKRIQREMPGIACAELHQTEDERQNLVRNRSFGKMVTDLSSLQSAITHYIASNATKLREQNTLAHIVGVLFIYTNRFREDLPQYQGCQQLALFQGSNDSITLNHVAQKLLKTLYRSDYEYKKCGIELSGIEPQTAFRQPDLWLPESGQHNDLMQALDTINARYGRSKVCLGSEPTDWHMTRDNFSPCFTTQWAESPVVD